jgi:hypothetical protein
VKPPDPRDDAQRVAAIRSALSARAAEIEIGPDEMHERVTAARQAAFRSRRVGPALRVLALAAVLAGGGLVALSVGARNPQQVPSNSMPTGSPAVTGPAVITASSAPKVAAGSRTASGIPTSFAGQPVEIGFAAILHANATTDATPFLIGGWFNDGSGYACGGAVRTDPTPLLTPCPIVVGGNDPWSESSFPGWQGEMYWDDHRLPHPWGPSIVRVHTHDPRAAACHPENHTQCESTIVVEAVLWVGDAWTSAAPISVGEADRMLENISIVKVIQLPPNNTLGVVRRLFTTSPDKPCVAPWPHEVFALRGDPQFVLLAVFPDVASRAAAQAGLDPTAPGCAVDPRVARPGAPTWVGVQNVLVLVYGQGAGAAAQTALTSDPLAEGPQLGFPPDTLDESYRTVADAEAARASGSLDSYHAVAYGSATYATDSYRRYTADALSYTIGPGRPVTQADVGATRWADLARWAVPGTARLYVVDHPASTVPALAREVLVAYKLAQPSLDTWGLMVIGH